MSSTWRILAGDTRPLTSPDKLRQQLLAIRHVPEESSASFFFPQYEKDIHDPYLIAGMKTAVDRIWRAVEKEERIFVHGDYDVDGVSATAVLVTTLQTLGAHVVPFLPHRSDDGYGINRGVLEHALSEFDLLITVDCGMSSHAEIEWLVSRGKDVIVTDHHELPIRSHRRPTELPPALAIIHPRYPAGEYPWPHLSGAGVAWKVCQALYRDTRFSSKGEPESEKWLLDLPLLGTVGDMMPLLGENRAIVTFGLAVLRRTHRPGLKALMEVAGIFPSRVSADDISYRLAPLLNAPGRMEHPQLALDLLLAKTSRRATEIAGKIAEVNARRQKLTRQLVEKAGQGIDLTAPIVFAANMDWPAGIVGLVAGQLAKKYDRPAVIVGGNGRHAVGSARTANGINILEGLQSAAQYAMRVGGHAQAAGFSLAWPQIEQFRDALYEYFHDQQEKPHSEEAVLTADALIDPSLLNWPVQEMLETFAPFGAGNSRPQFVVRGVPLLEARLVGKQGKHLKFRFHLPHGELDAIGFGLGERLDTLGREIDILGSLEVNEFRGRPGLQMKLTDIAAPEHITLMA